MLRLWLRSVRRPPPLAGPHRLEQVGRQRRRLARWFGLAFGGRLELGRRRHPRAHPRVGQRLGLVGLASVRAGAPAASVGACADRSAARLHARSLAAARIAPPAAAWADAKIWQRFRLAIIAGRRLELRSGRHPWPRPKVRQRLRCVLVARRRRWSRRRRHARTVRQVRLGRVILGLDRLRRSGPRPQPALLHRRSLRCRRGRPPERHIGRPMATRFVVIPWVGGMSFERLRRCRLARNLLDFGDGAAQPCRPRSPRRRRRVGLRFRASFAADALGGDAVVRSRLAVAPVFVVPVGRLVYAGRVRDRRVSASTMGCGALRRGTPFALLSLGSRGGRGILRTPCTTRCNSRTATARPIRMKVPTRATVADTSSAEPNTVSRIGRPNPIRNTPAPSDHEAEHQQKVEHEKSAHPPSWTGRPGPDGQRGADSP